MKKPLSDCALVYTCRRPAIEFRLNRCAGIVDGLVRRGGCISSHAAASGHNDHVESAAGSHGRIAALAGADVLVGELAGLAGEHRVVAAFTWIRESPQTGTSSISRSLSATKLLADWGFVSRKDEALLQQSAGL